MTIRQRIILILTACCLVVSVSAQGASLTPKKKLPILSATKKISVKHSRSKDQSTIGELRANIETTVSTKIKEHTIKVEASAYTLSKRETDRTPFMTSTGERPIVGKTCAVSRDQRHRLMHKMILIPGLGLREVNDTMHQRYKNSIDVVFPNRKAAKEFGRKDVQIVVLN